MGYIQTFDNTSSKLFNLWNPPPKLTISEWADEHGVLTAGSSAEPGRWRTYPPQRAIMDAFGATEVETVVCMKSKRMGWTKIIGHIVGYHVHQDAAAVLIVQPTIADAEGYSKEEIQPMIDETRVLRDRVSALSSRTSSNTMTKKRYPGGMLHMIGANSPAGFRRITVRVVLFDEVDGYPPTAGAEGDQISLGMGRAETFWNRKYGIGSTPTIKGVSRVEKHFDESSKGYPLLVCPECGEEHIRRFRQPERPIVLQGAPVPVSHLVWDDGKPTTAAWVCPGCGVRIDHTQHGHMLQGLRWRGEDWDWDQHNGFSFMPGFAGKIGFHLWAGYSMSPNATPARLAKDFLEAKKNPETLVVFVNTVLGEPWEEKGESVEQDVLENRRENYSDKVPAGVTYLSAGVDIQQDRIEAEIVGWGPGEESWSIDYLILPGEPAQAEVWDDLDDALAEGYPHASGGGIYVSAIAVDRGYLAKKVDEYVLRCKNTFIWGVIGRSGFGRSVIESQKQRIQKLRRVRKIKAPREVVGVDDAKLILLRRLSQVKKPGPGYCHFGMHCDSEYFAQLTGEKLVVRYHNGVHRAWIATRPRVEALDCRNYAYAAMLLSAADLSKSTVRAVSSEGRKSSNHSEFKVI